MFILYSQKTARKSCSGSDRDTKTCLCCNMNQRKHSHKKAQGIYQVRNWFLFIGYCLIFVSGAKSQGYSKWMNEWIQFSVLSADPTSTKFRRAFTYCKGQCIIPQYRSGETSKTELEKGSDNCLVAGAGNFLPTGSCQSSATTPSYSHQVPKEVRTQSY